MHESLCACFVQTICDPLHSYTVYKNPTAKADSESDMP